MEEIKQQISTSEAIALAEKAGIKVTRPTLITWCKDNKVGHQLGTGKWMVYKDIFIAFLNGGTNNEK